MAVSWRLAGMLNSYLSIPFHFYLEISGDGLLVLLVYEGFCQPPAGGPVTLHLS